MNFNIVAEKRTTKKAKYPGAATRALAYASLHHLTWMTTSMLLRVALL
jgi:hypothetical protein